MKKNMFEPESTGTLKHGPSVQGWANIARMIHQPAGIHLAIALAPLVDCFYADFYFAGVALAGYSTGFRLRLGTPLVLSQFYILAWLSLCYILICSFPFF